MSALGEEADELNDATFGGDDLLLAAPLGGADPLLPDFFGGPPAAGSALMGALEEGSGNSKGQQLLDFVRKDEQRGGGQQQQQDQQQWAKQQAEFEQLRRLQAERLQQQPPPPGIMSLQALEAAQALGGLINEEAEDGGLGDEELVGMAHEIDKLTLDDDEEDEGGRGGAALQPGAAAAGPSAHRGGPAPATTTTSSSKGPRVMSLREIEEMDQQQRRPAVLPPPLSAGRVVPWGEMMRAKDVLYVIQAQLRQMDTGADAFTEDYYYTQAVLREARQQDEGGDAPGSSSKSVSAAPPSGLPVPVWKETKEMARKQHAAEVMEARARTMKWEEGHRVLGHTNKSAINKPRELLAIAKNSDEQPQAQPDQPQQPQQDQPPGAEELGEGGAVLLALSKPFTGSLWKTRRLVDQVHVVLLGAVECEQALHNPYLLPAKAAEVRDQLALLRQELALLLLPSSSPLVLSLLELPKGVKALALALPLLPPSAAQPLLPCLLTALVSRPPPPPSSDWGVAEAPLLQALLQALRKEPGPPLSVLMACVEGVVKTFLAGPLQPSGLSLRAALSSRPRAEVVHSVLQRGKAEAEGDSLLVLSADRDRWRGLQDKLIQMLQQP